MPVSAYTAPLEPLASDPISSADIDGVGVGSGANLVVDQLGFDGGADHTSADLEVGPEWNVMGYKVNAKGDCAGRSPKPEFSGDRSTSQSSTGRSSGD